MSPLLMSRSQQSATASNPGHLDQGRAMRLDATGQARWLRVTQGRLWLTHSAQSHEEVPLDCWLEAGDSVELPALQDAVLEAWPSARFEVLTRAPASGGVNASVALKPSASLRRWLKKLRPSEAPAACAS